MMVQAPILRARAFNVRTGTPRCDASCAGVTYLGRRSLFIVSQIFFHGGDFEESFASLLRLLHAKDFPSDAFVGQAIN